MQCNLCRFGRAARLTGGFLVLGGGVWAWLIGSLATPGLLGVGAVGLVLLLTGATGYCPLNRLLGVEAACRLSPRPPVE